MLKTLQASRALAAISVASYHLSIVMGMPRYGGDAAFSSLTGHIGGVRFFFVLSGFIILYAHAKDIGRPGAWRSYLGRRFIRLFPVYWIYSIPFCLLVALGLGTDARIPSDPLDWLSSITLVRFTSAMPPLRVAWSLFHEVAFYAVFSLLILNKRLGMAAFLAVAVFSALFYNYPAESERTAWHVYTAAYNFYFLLGMGAYGLYRRGGNGLAELGVGLAVWAGAMLMPPLPRQLSYLVLVTGFALLLAGVAKLEAARHFTVPRLLVLIGNASYTLYLVHEQLQGLLLKLALKSHVYQWAGARATYAAVLAATIGLAYLVYVLVERPLSTALRRRYEQGRATTLPAQALPS